MKRFFSLIFTVFFVHSLQAMDDAIVANNKKIVFEVVLSHGKQWFSYDMINSLGVSKEYDAILRNTAEDRKRYMEQHPKFTCFSKKKFVWRKYGTVCDCVSDVEHVYSRKKGTSLLTVYLIEDGKLKVERAFWEHRYENKKLFVPIFSRQEVRRRLDLMRMEGPPVESQGCFSNCFAGIIEFFRGE